MKTKWISPRIVSVVIASFLIGSCGLMACGSDNDGAQGGGGTTNNTPGEIPTNSDNGKNNNSQPDNEGGSGSESGGGNEGGGNTGGGSTGTTSEWTLVFEDDFEGTSEIPNQEYWTLAPKGTDTWNRHMSESYNQAYQKEGYLYLFGMMSDGEYLTGGIETRNKFDFQYGQVKCRARFLRQPQGNHTGIWMMPEEQYHGAWPRSGEIDIMEHLNDQDVIYSTVHYWDSQKNEGGSSDKTAQVDNNEFNVYGVIWSNEKVSFTVNSEVIFTYANENPGSNEFYYQYPFVEPFYLILSQSLGGAGTWEGEIDNSELPAVFQIDWIKVWQKTDETGD